MKMEILLSNIVSEVQPYQTIFVRKKGPVSNVEEIEGIMKKKVPGYLQGFEFLNIRAGGNYIRRLRYELFKSLLSLTPDIFIPEELRLLYNYVFYFSHLPSKKTMF